MLVITGIDELKAFIRCQKQEGLSIGFVPTMGALHRGHLSLVAEAASTTDCVVVSIFVNPTQFNDPVDLAKYPRTPERDLNLLEATACDMVFAPTEVAMYPHPGVDSFDFAGLDKVMEGNYRPGHFNGVAHIVGRLFDLIEPDKAFFGLKDFQQVAIVRSLVRQRGIHVDIVACPIIREPDGLAMSSRNALLTSGQRENAAHIYKTLSEARNLCGHMNVQEVKEWVVGQVDANEHLKTEYFEIVDDTDLKAVDSWEQPVNKVGCIAVFCGKIRLIDNIMFSCASGG